MNRSTVAVIRCDSYDEDQVFESLRRGIDLLGGVRRFVSPGEKILLKPNVLVGKPPELAASTHPAVVRAAGRLVLGVTRQVLYGDSPGLGAPGPALERSGIAAAARGIGLQPADFERGRMVRLPPGSPIDSVPIAEGALQADGLINLCKLKTHALTRMTGAVKNLFGCIPGFQKKKYHVLLPSSHDFSRLLVFLHPPLKARLHVMDGILAMEGNGPGAGHPRPMRVLLLSTDPVALDAVMCRLVELDPLHLPTSAPGERHGLGAFRAEDIELKGDPPAALTNGDFLVPRGPVHDYAASGLLGLANSLLSSRPVIERRLCRRCGRCLEACPIGPPALGWPAGDRSRPPVYHYGRCIRCYCCQEICPEGAIRARRRL